MWRTLLPGSGDTRRRPLEFSAARHPLQHGGHSHAASGAASGVGASHPSRGHWGLWGLGQRGLVGAEIITSVTQIVSTIHGCRSLPYVDFLAAQRGRSSASSEIDQQV